jgi:hypothetical protein|tara:strand:+ start:570 stop:758 length:189 start_codon:yes stop_codon:yes gene_type:complete
MSEGDRLTIDEARLDRLLLWVLVVGCVGWLATFGGALWAGYAVGSADGRAAMLDRYGATEAP